MLFLLTAFYLSKAVAKLRRIFELAKKNDSKNSRSTSPLTVSSHNFYATEVCGNSIIPAHNYFTLFHHAFATSPKKSFLKTIRYEYINTPTYFSKSKDKYVLHLAAHWIYYEKTR